ncbi:Rac GTPase-activating protein 1 [Deinococcus grandis]|uniref:Rac GTPase-activating protein 1 n=1 Tax=Deinococcus grandis TaxID=57498 RepID=A0A100HGP3_9DEIO|nr:hypothetical protein DEGR_29150 [Deinococcus grandis]GAQ20335.1 Rac GTPase-activating protein 1 [Deinococcus grandis]
MRSGAAHAERWGDGRLPPGGGVGRAMELASQMTTRAASYGFQTVPTRPTHRDRAPLPCTPEVA